HLYQHSYLQIRSALTTYASFIVAVNDYSRSQIMSSTSSIPTEIRTRSSGIPAAANCSSDNCWGVVEPGCSINVLASPILARCDANCKLAINVADACRPPFTPKLYTEPTPKGNSCLPRS